MAYEWEYLRRGLKDLGGSVWDAFWAIGSGTAVGVLESIQEGEGVDWSLIVLAVLAGGVVSFLGRTLKALWLAPARVEREKRKRLEEQVEDLEAAVRWGSHVPIQSELLKGRAPSVAYQEAKEWWEKVLAKAKAGDPHAKAKLPAVARELRHWSAEWGASPERARQEARIAQAMKDLGIPWE